MYPSPNSLSIPCTTSGQALVPTCYFGNCNSTVLPSCICLDGYRHDRLTGRYYNCAMPSWVPWAGGALSLTVTMLGFLYGMFVITFRSAKYTLAWRVALTAALASLGFFGASLSLHASPNLEMPVYGALLNNAGTALTAYSIGIMVVISLAPVDRFSKSKYGLEFFRKFMFYGLPGFLAIGTTACTITGYALDDDQAVTDAMGGVYVVLAIGAVIACPIMFFHMRNFIRALDDAIKLNSEQRNHVSDNTDTSLVPSPMLGSPKRISKSKPTTTNDNVAATSRDKLADLRGKVRALMITATLSSFLVALVCLMCAAFQFAARTVPMSWIVYYGITIAVGLFALQLSHSAKKSKVEVRSRRKSSVIAESDILSKSQGTT